MKRFGERSRKLIAGAALAAVGLGIATPALAHAPGFAVDRDNVKMNYGNVDFGGGVVDWFGNPTGHALVSFSLTSDGDVGAGVHGRVFWNNPGAGSGKARIQFMDENHDTIPGLNSVWSDEACKNGIGFGNPWTAVEAHAEHPDIRYVRINLYEGPHCGADHDEFDRIGTQSKWVKIGDV